MNRFKLAQRNILRNGQRTTLNLLMIAGGFCAIVLFQGFSEYLLDRIKSTAINNQYGHLQIAKNNFWNPIATEAPKDRVIENPSELITQLSSPEVEYASGRISFFGLFSSGDRTISAQFVGFDPKIETGMLNGLKILKGENFPQIRTTENLVLAGKGIFDQLGGEVGQEFTILANTHDGVINAMDVKIQGVFVTQVSEVDNTTIYLPLEVAQKILDTNSVERLVVVLKNEKLLTHFLNNSNIHLPNNLKAKKWDELATLFRQVQDFYAVQNRVIEAIILALVLLSISNTVGMSIFERTGEIGTLRALGDTGTDIIKNFVVEGFLLGISGSLLGLLLAISVSVITNNLGFLMTIPGASIPIRIEILFIPQSYLYAATLTILTTIIATYIPASRTSKVQIVEALRYNI